MAETGDNTVRAALEAVVRDHGWLAASNPVRLRALISDALGAHADDHRGLLDAVVVSAEEGVPADLRQAGRDGADAVRPELVARLTSWGLTADRAEWVVDAWKSLIQQSTFGAPAIAPEPTAPAPTAVPPVVERPGPPLVAGAPGPTELPTPPAPTELPGTPVVTELPPDPKSDPKAGSKPPPRNRTLWVIGAVVVALVLGGGGVALARSGHGSKHPGTSSPTNSASGKAAADWTLVADPDAKPAVAAKLFSMAAKSGGVKIAALGPVTAIGTGSAAQVAPAGGQLVGFTLAGFKCEVAPCTTDVSKLGLKIAEGANQVPLPAGGPTYVLAVPAGQSADLVYAADGFQQRLSLLDGHPDGRNITVLARPVRTGTVATTRFHVAESFAFNDVQPAGLTAGNEAYQCRSSGGRDVTIGSAKLSYFAGGYASRRPLSDPSKAYVYIAASYAQPKCGSGQKGLAFDAALLKFVPDSGPACVRRYFPPKGNLAGYYTAFVCDGSVSAGTFTIGGTTTSTVAVHNPSGPEGSERVVDTVHSRSVHVTFP